MNEREKRRSTKKQEKMSTLNIKFIEKRLREKISNVDVSADLRIVREETAKLIKLPSTAFDIIYAGQVLEDGKTLESYGIKSGVTIHAVSRKVPEEEIKPESFDDRAITQLLTALHAALINPVHRHAVYTILNNPDTLKNIAATTPGLTSDHVAMAFLRDADLIIQISDPDNLKKIVSQHPAIGHAAIQIAASAVNETNSRLGAALSSSQEPGFMSDEEMDTTDSSNTQNNSRRSNQHNATVRPISANQLAAALNASRGASASRSSSRENTSLGSQPITVDMFTQAMAQALQASASLAGTPSNSNSTNPQLSREDLQDQMRTLRDMGFSDEEQNLRALRASNGIVHDALDLIISQRF